MRLRLGTHPNNVSLHAFGNRADLLAELTARGVDVEVFHYNTGSQSIPLMIAGALDVVGTGSTPPLLAAAAGLDVVTIAMTRSRGDSGGLLVRADSEITTPEDLRGASIAVMPTSWHPPYVATLLQRHGLSWNDATVVELNTPTAVEALRRGAIDAWVATGPDHRSVSDQFPVRVLAPVRPYHSNRSVLWGLRSVVDADHTAILALLDALNTSDLRLADDPDGVAATLTDHESAGRLGHTLTEREHGWLLLDEEFTAEQQRHADLLHAEGVLPRPVDVHPTVFTPVLAGA